MGDTSSEIFLDLRPGRDGGANEAGGFIQLDAEQQLIKLLTDTEIPSASGKLPGVANIIPHRRHDAVFVNARRGAGKTTFLIKVLERFEAEGVPTASGRSLRPLGIIDPTLIETKQHIVVVVIDRIRAVVDEHKRSGVRSGAETYEAFQQSLRRLARGLGMLDGIGKDAFYGREWADSEFVLDQGLEDARAAVVFEQAFHEYIQRACEFLDIHSFVLAIDDIDTWFERGWPVLEAVRKYLTSPRLQIVLSGDLELYSLLVRASQWKQMGKDFLAAEQWQERPGSHGRMASLTRKVDELQDQYLIKVLKPERRIDLPPLFRFKDRLRLRLSDANPVDAEFFAKHFCEQVLGLRAPAERREVLDLLLRLPTRSALQIMLAAAAVVETPDKDTRGRAIDGLRYVAWTDLLNLQLSPGDTQALAPRMLPSLLARWFTEAELWRTLPRFHPETLEVGYGLPAIFGAALSVESFRADPSQMLVYWLKISTIREMLDGNLVSEEESRAPAEGRTLKNLIGHLNLLTFESSLQTVSRLAAWELVLKRQVKPGVYFSVVSVPLDRVRERNVAAWDLYGQPYKQGRAAAGSQLKSFVRDILDDVNDALPAPLRGFHRKLAEVGWEFPKRDAGFEGGFANAVTTLKHRISGPAKFVVEVPALQILSGQQKYQGGYSFLRLIATVAELLEPVEAEESADALRERIRTVLSTAGLLRSYPTPGTDTDDEIETRTASRGGRAAAQSAADDDGDDDSNDDGDVGDGGDGNDLEALVAALEAWVRHWLAIQITPLAPLVLSRIWARFNYAHRSIRQRLKHLESRYLGVFMFRSLVAFLHAVLIESVRATGGLASSNANNNPITAPEPFVYLLREVGELGNDDVPKWGSRELELFEALFTCPLWTYFLPREPDIVWKRERDANKVIYDAYRQRRKAHKLADDATFAKVVYRPDGGETKVEFDGLYDLLNTVQMQGNPRKARKAVDTEQDPPAEAAP